MSIMIVTFVLKIRYYHTIRQVERATVNTRVILNSVSLVHYYQSAPKVEITKKLSLVMFGRIIWRFVKIFVTKEG